MNKQLQALTMERRLAASRLANLAGKEQPKTEQPAAAKAKAVKPRMTKKQAFAGNSVIPTPVHL